HKFGDGLQRIEQKVRLELHLQSLQLRLRQARFQFDGAQFPFSKFVVEFNRMRATGDRQISEEIRMKVIAKDQPRQIVPMKAALNKDGLDARGRGENCPMQQRER